MKLNKKCPECNKLVYYDPLSWRKVVFPDKTSKKMCPKCAGKYFGKNGYLVLTA